MQINCVYIRLSGLKNTIEVELDKRRMVCCIGSCLSEMSQDAIIVLALRRWDVVVNPCRD